MDEDTPSAVDTATKLVSLGKTIAAFWPHFPNLRKVRDRLLGDVSDAAFDALVSRLHLYETRNRAGAVKTAIERTGLPPTIVHEMMDRQESIDTIVASAIGRIVLDPDKPTKAKASETTSDDDWFDVYRREAAVRSAGEMREAFVRVLAGEIQEPGTFSVKTLRVLGEISTPTAEKFRRAASICISRGNDDARIPAVGGTLGQNCLRDIGLSFDVLTSLTENGLVHSDYSCKMSYGPFHEANPGISLPPNMQLPFLHQGNQWVLLGTTDGAKKKALQVVGAAFTQAGQELLRVVEMEPMPLFTERLKAHFANSNYDMMQVSEDTKLYQ